MKTLNTYISINQFSKSKRHVLYFINWLFYDVMKWSLFFLIHFIRDHILPFSVSWNPFEVNSSSFDISVISSRFPLAGLLTVSLPHRLKRLKFLPKGLISCIYNWRTIMNISYWNVLDFLIAFLFHYLLNRLDFYWGTCNIIQHA